MARTSKKKSKESVTVREDHTESERETSRNPKENDRDPEGDQRGMDFGGLPSRDLKKNLGGCG